MTPERWREIAAIFYEALARDAAQRDAFVLARCGRDVALQREVEAMLAGHDASGRSGETPIVALSGTLEGGVASPHRTLSPGTRLASYEIVSLLGIGGMGEVYRARDTKLNREVAIKVVLESFVSDWERVARFQREAKMLAALNHPNICVIHDVDKVDGHPFIVMEFMKGEDLRTRLTLGPLSIQQVIDCGLQIADALDAAHTQGIIHRDIKSANIFVTDRGHVKVLDFGLATALPRTLDEQTTAAAANLTAQGAALGTIAYMSPEQAMGEELDGRTDLFSLGVVLYECATGTRPFSASTPGATLAAILSRSPAAPTALNPDVPPRLQDVILRCLEKDRALRYQSASHLRADLQLVRRDIEVGHARTIGDMKGVARRDAAARWVFRQRGPRLWLGVAGIVAVSLASYSFWPSATPSRSATDNESAALVTAAAVADDAAIRRVVETYARAIETRNISLLQSVKPDLSAEERERLETAFKVPFEQFVSFRILSIDQKQQNASVRLMRRDSIHIGGRHIVNESQQVMTLDRTPSGFWLIAEVAASPQPTPQR